MPAVCFRKKAHQFCFNHARVHAFDDGNDTFERHFAANLFLPHADFDFSSAWKEKEIRHTDAIDCGNECNSDSAANFADVIEMLHDLNKAKDRADDADCWSKTAGGFEHFGDVILVLGLVVEFELHHLADFL